MRFAHFPSSLRPSVVNRSRTFVRSSSNDAPPPEIDEQPWTIFNYVTKKKVRKYGPLGELISDEETLKDPAAWTGEAMWTLAVESVAREQSCSVEDINAGVQRIFRLLPGLQQRLGNMKPGDLARLGCKAEAVARRLVHLKTALPQVNLDLVVSRQPAILSWPDGKVEAGYAKAAELLCPGLSEEDLARLIEQSPTLLDTETLEGAVSEVRRLLPGSNVGRMMLNMPDLLLSVQSLASQQRGDRDEDYLASIFRAC